MARARLIEGADLGAALGLLTRLPVPPGAHAVARGGRAAWAYPLVGALVGALAGLVGAAALAVGLPATAAAWSMLAAQALLTGALHEDGLADAADGIWGGGTRERRLAIMRDSQIGTYGAMALALSLGARAALLGSLAPGMLIAGAIAAGALSRGGMALVMASLPPARADGLSAGVGRPGPATVALAGGLALAAAGSATGPAAALVAALAAGVACTITGALAHSKLGGQTGDVLGAAQQAGEVAALAALVALA